MVVMGTGWACVSLLLWVGTVTMGRAPWASVHDCPPCVIQPEFCRYGITLSDNGCCIVCYEPPRKIMVPPSISDNWRPAQYKPPENYSILPLKQNWPRTTRMRSLERQTRQTDSFEVLNGKEGESKYASPHHGEPSKHGSCNWAGCHDEEKTHRGDRRPISGFSQQPRKGESYVGHTWEPSKKAGALDGENKKFKFHELQQGEATNGKFRYSGKVWTKKQPGSSSKGEFDAVGGKNLEYEENKYDYEPKTKSMYKTTNDGPMVISLNSEKNSDSFPTRPFLSSEYYAPPRTVRHYIDVLQLQDRSFDNVESLRSRSDAHYSGKHRAVKVLENPPENYMINQEDFIPVAEHPFQSLASSRLIPCECDDFEGGICRCGKIGEVGLYPFNRHQSAKIHPHKDIGERYYPVPIIYEEPDTFEDYTQHGGFISNVYNDHQLPTDSRSAGVRTYSSEELSEIFNYLMNEPEDIEGLSYFPIKSSEIDDELMKSVETNQSSKDADQAKNVLNNNNNQVKGKSSDDTMEKRTLTINENIKLETLIRDRISVAPGNKSNETKANASERKIIKDEENKSKPQDLVKMEDSNKTIVTNKTKEATNSTKGEVKQMTNVTNEQGKPRNNTLSITEKYKRSITLKAIADFKELLEMDGMDAKEPIEMELFEQCASCSGSHREKRGIEEKLNSLADKIWKSVRSVDEKEQKTERRHSFPSEDVTALKEHPEYNNMKYITRDDIFDARRRQQAFLDDNQKINKQHTFEKDIFIYPTTEQEVNDEYNKEVPTNLLRRKSSSKLHLSKDDLTEVLVRIMDHCLEKYKAVFEKLKDLKDDLHIPQLKDFIKEIKQKIKQELQNMYTKKYKSTLNVPHKFIIFNDNEDTMYESLLNKHIENPQRANYLKDMWGYSPSKQTQTDTEKKIVENSSPKNNKLPKYGRNEAFVNPMEFFRLLGENYELGKLPKEPKYFNIPIVSTGSHTADNSPERVSSRTIINQELLPGNIHHLEEMLEEGRKKSDSSTNKGDIRKLTKWLGDLGKIGNKDLKTRDDENKLGNRIKRESNSTENNMSSLKNVQQNHGYDSFVKYREKIKNSPEKAENLNFQQEMQEAMDSFFSKRDVRMSGKPAGNAKRRKNSPEKTENINFQKEMQDAMESYFSKRDVRMSGKPEDNVNNKNSNSTSNMHRGTPTNNRDDLQFVVEF